MLHDIESATVVALLAKDASGAATRVAEELGVFTVFDAEEFAARGVMDLVIDARDEVAPSDDIQSRVEIAGTAACELLLDLFAARRLGLEQRQLSGELEEALERSRSRERQLNASTSALETANAELQAQLSEIYFAHEFFKALTRYTAVEDVCSLAVDGLSGLLGSEMSCVYLCNREDWTLRLHACQGRGEDAFAPVVSVDETILGHAFRDGVVQEADVPAGSLSRAWVESDVSVLSQAAAPLTAGDSVVGVIAMASTSGRTLTDPEMERLSVLGSQVSLSLQNALLLAELERLAVTDRLTQLYNRGYFQQRLEEEFGRSSRFGHHLSVLVIDVDDFKSINERFGHPCGDEVLREVSSVVRSTLRSMDVAARYGGEVFTVLLPQTDLAGAQLVAERIREEVESLTIACDRSLSARCTVTVGAAAFPDNAATAARLVEAAQRALQSAKQAGKNRTGVVGI
jgi:diguanylate cyclase (GGDEF)-like protein